MLDVHTVLASRDASVAVVAGCALVAHIIFNRYEPIDPVPLISLLVLFPASLSVLLARHFGVTLGGLLAFLTYYATLGVSICLYRISPLHPLASYPGPLPAKLTRWWWTRHALNGHQHELSQQLHEKYGDIVRIGPNEVSIRNMASVQPMMGIHGMPKGPLWTGRSFHGKSFNPPLFPLIGIRDSAEHLRRRRPWFRAFSSAALKEYQPIVAKLASQLVQVISERKRVDFVHWVHLFTFDFMSEAMFGEGSDMLTHEDKDGLLYSMSKGFDDQHVFEHIPWLSLYARHFKRFSATTQRFRYMCFQKGMKRYERGSEIKDLFYYLSNEDGAEKQSPPKQVVIADSAFAMIAATDTTASVLSNVLYCILRYPHVYKRLQAEVDQFYPPEADSLDTSPHPKMPYLDAVINEAMRLWPVNPGGSQRAPAKGSGGGTVGPYFLPEGTQCRIHFWSVHRDERNFSYPHTYYPDRWLIAAGLQAAPEKEPLVHTPAAFLPFSVGPANCVGKNLAMMEMRMVLCHMMQRLEIRFDPAFDPETWVEKMEDRFVLRTGPLPIVVEPRK